MQAAVEGNTLEAIEEDVKIITRHLAEDVEAITMLIYLPHSENEVCVVLAAVAVLNHRVVAVTSSNRHVRSVNAKILLMRLTVEQPPKVKQLLQDSV